MFGTRIKTKEEARVVAEYLAKRMKPKALTRNTHGPIGIREGDIEALKNKMADRGKPIKTDLIRDKNDELTHFKEEKGRVKVLSSDYDN